MASVRELLSGWAGYGAPRSDYEQAEISLVWPEPIAAEPARAQVAEAVGDTAFELRPAFEGPLAEGQGGRFWILAFPKLVAYGAETVAFEAARALREALSLSSARPVLVDSLVGAGMISGPEPAADVFGGCESKDPGPQARGWAPFKLGVRDAWAQSRGQGVTIASIDTGVSDHLELAGVRSAKPARNLVEGGSDPSDRFSTNVFLPNPGHGTLVASVAASRGDLDAGGETGGPSAVTGAAPLAEILPIRAIRSVVDIRQSRIPAAIEHALSQDADIMVMALGSAFHIEPVEYALRAANAVGMLTICAAGNCVGLVVFPARLAPQGIVTAVAAVDYLYQPWEKTSKGPEVVVSAFGEAVWGARKRAATDPNDVIAPSQGTTLATALTCGVAALWMGRWGRPALRAAASAAGTTVQKIFNELVARTAYRPPSGWRPGMGAGVVDAARLLAEPLPPPSAALSDALVPEPAFTPLRRYLEPTLGEADALAGAEAASLEEDDAAEALWRLYKANARRRAEAFGTKLSDLPASDAGETMTPGLKAKLATRPRLAAWLT